MDIILSFDTEDYITPSAADAQKWWADELHARGIRGSFQCVGEVVRTHRRSGRDDVIEALGRHEIGNHTDYHSMPPTHPAAMSGKSFAECVDWAIRYESASFATLERAFGRVPIGYCAPGDSWTPATLVAFAAMGAKVFANGKLGDVAAGPYWYCGLLTGNYNFSFENFFAREDRSHDDFVQMFRSTAEEIGDDGVMILCSHPTMLVTERFWDMNFFRSQCPPRDEWKPAPLRTDRQVQTNKDRIRGYLDWLQKRGDLRFVDYATFYAERPANRRSLQALLDETGLRPGMESQLPLRRPTDDSFIRAECFDNFRYSWPIHPEGFDGGDLIDQARGLAWTAGPAGK